MRNDRASVDHALPRRAILIVNTKSRRGAEAFDGVCAKLAAAIGLSPIIAETVPAKLKRYLGKGGYLLWAMWCALRFRPYRLAVTTADGRTAKLWVTEVRIANGTYHGGVQLIKHQEIDNGSIVV